MANAADPLEPAAKKIKTAKKSVTPLEFLQLHSRLFKQVKDEDGDLGTLLGNIFTRGGREFIIGPGLMSACTGRNERELCVCDFLTFCGLGGVPFDTDPKRTMALQDIAEHALVAIAKKYTKHPNNFVSDAEDLEISQSQRHVKCWFKLHGRHMILELNVFSSRPQLTLCDKSDD
jgi:hypothetical protein